MAINLPYSFVPGTLIRSTEVNANFTSFAISSAPQTITADTTWTTPIHVSPNGLITINSGVTLTINGPFSAGMYQVFGGSGSVVFGSGAVTEVYPEWFMPATPTQTETAHGLQQAVNAYRVVKLSGAYAYDTTLQIDIRGTHLIGSRGVNTTNVVALKYYGTGSAIQIGSDDGRPDWSAGSTQYPLYNGVQGFVISDVYLWYQGPGTTALLNGKGDYGTDTYGVRDWRGGDVSLIRCTIHGFACGFWSIQSDFDVIDNCTITKNSVGVFAGPRSTQMSIIGGTSAFNDTGYRIDGAISTVFYHWTTKDEGSATTYPIEVVSNYSSIGTGAVIFNDCWFENYGEGYQGTVDAFIAAGLSGTTTVREIHVNRPIILNNADGYGYPRTTNFINSDNAESIHIDKPFGRQNQNTIYIDNLFLFTGTHSPVCRYTPSGQRPIKASGEESVYTNSGSGYPTVKYLSNYASGQNDGSGGMIYNIDPIGTSPNTGAAAVRMFRGVNTSGNTYLDILQGDGTGTVAHRLDAKGNLHAGYGASNGAWDTHHFQIGSYHLWVDSAGKLRIKAAAPTSDTDGVVVGAQT